MPAPSSATAAVFPDWTNLVDNWRDTDAEWLRNRTVSPFADAAARDAVMNPVTKNFGMMSIIQAGSVAGGPDFWNGLAWEGIRYPNLAVSSDATSVTLKRQGAGSGIQLLSDGSVNTVKNVVGTGGVGYVGDQTGIALTVGAKTVKLATNATALTIDSPVAITGGLTLTGPLTVPSETVTGALTVQGTAALAGVTATTVAATGLVSGGNVNGGDAQLGTVGVFGVLRHRTGGTSAVSVGSDSTVKIDGASLTINPPTTLAGALTVTGVTTFVGRPVLSLPGTSAGVWVAGIRAAAGNIAPTQNDPDGTVYVTY
jgi:hypothetical protein